MTDLKELLRETAERSSGPALDPHTLLDRGRRRVRQRRLRVAAAVVAGVVAAGVAASTGLLAARHPLPADRPGSFQRVQVPRAEALDRCQASLGRTTGMLYGYQPDELTPMRGTGTLDDGARVRNPPQPWFEGTVLYYATADAPHEAVPCMVPAKGARDAGALRAPDAKPGTTAFRDECAHAGGLDLDRWQYAAGARSRVEVVGLFVSPNGWTLQCRYPPTTGTTPQPPALELGTTGAAAVPPASGPTGNRVWIGCRAFLDEYNVYEGGCFGAGAATDDGRPVASLRVSMPGGERTVRVHDGFYAFAFDGPDVQTRGLAPRRDWARYQQATVTSYDRDGLPIATHEVALLTPYSRL